MRYFLNALQKYGLFTFGARKSQKKRVFRPVLTIVNIILATSVVIIMWTEGARRCRYLVIVVVSFPQISQIITDKERACAI